MRKTFLCVLQIFVVVSVKLPKHRFDSHRNAVVITFKPFGPKIQVVVNTVVSLLDPRIDGSVEFIEFIDI